MVAWTNADWPVFASWQGPILRLVAVNWYGVARPLALNGSGGTMSVQLGLTAAAAAGWAFAAAALADADAAGLAPAALFPLTVAAHTPVAVARASGTAIANMMGIGRRWDTERLLADLVDRPVGGGVGGVG